MLVAGICILVFKVTAKLRGGTKVSLNATYLCYVGFSAGSDDEESTCNVGDPGSVPGLGRSAGEGNGNPLQYSCLGTPMDMDFFIVFMEG